MAKVTFQPSGQECEAKVGDSLLKVANREKAGVKFSCGGVPSCAMCRVGIVSGEEHLSSIDRKETDLMGNTYFLTKQRLSCQAKIITEGDLVVDVSEHTAVKVELKDGETYSSSFRKPKEQWKLTKEEEEKLKPKQPERRRRPRNSKKNRNKPGPKKKDNTDSGKSSES